MISWCLQTQVPAPVSKAIGWGSAHPGTEANTSPGEEPVAPGISLGPDLIFQQKLKTNMQMLMRQLLIFKRWQVIHKFQRCIESTKWIQPVSCQAVTSVQKGIFPHPSPSRSHTHSHDAHSTTLTSTSPPGHSSHGTSSGKMSQLSLVPCLPSVHFLHSAYHNYN